MRPWGLLHPGTRVHLLPPLPVVELVNHRLRRDLGRLYLQARPQRGAPLREGGLGERVMLSKNSEIKSLKAVVDTQRNR